MNDLDILEQRAIDSAIASEWDKAVEFNKKILQKEKNNIATYLRLGFAYLQLEDIPQAKKYYKHALTIQPRNPVALENLERIEILQATNSKNPIKEKAVLNPSLFLETPGK